jgi:hypothetical protein
MIRSAVTFAQLTAVSVIGAAANDGYERLSPSAVDAAMPVVAVVGLLFFIGYAVANIRPAPRGRRGR